MSKQRGFSLINILGLTIGIACSMLLILYIQDELRYDRFHQDFNKIHRLAFEGKLQGRKTKSTQTGIPIGKTIQQLREVEASTRIANWTTFPVRYGDKIFTEKNLLLADSTFFHFFDFKLIVGDPDSVLQGERKVVITESAAKRYFDYKGKGDTSPIGQVLELAQGYVVKVSGIAEDPPLNSHFHFTLILSLRSWEVVLPQEFITGRVITYFKLKDESEIQHTESKINALLLKNIDSELRKNHGSSLDQYKKQGNELHYAIQPLKRIHLWSNISDELEPNGDIRYIYLFASIAVFVTILACINFMNLTTAQSSSRAKEVAVRKAVGAQHYRLMIQFLLESYMFVIIAVILACIVLVFVLSPFNYFTGKDLQIASLFDTGFLLGIAAFIFITGLAAGSYPAFYLTYFNPIEVLKGNLKRGTKTYSIRNILVVFQFFISASLIIATIIVYQQLVYMQRIDVGFKKENIINLLHTKGLIGKGEAFKNDLLKDSSIVSASYCNRLPPNMTWQAMFRPVGIEKDYLLAVYEMDYDHLNTMGYKMLHGRFFSKEMKDDSMMVILNQTAAVKLGMENFEGRKIFTNYDQPAGREREVIGIIQDFNSLSLKEPIQPMAVVLGNEPNWEMAIRVRDEGMDSALNHIQNTWKKYVPHAPFEYSLLENNFKSTNQTERKVGFLFLLFTLLAIIIACLGLFGLATFTADQHKKEIGIRKVMGASVENIVMMLNRNFMTLVLIANVLAWPFTWWAMQPWLDQFAYHIKVSWWVFIIAGAITVLIAFLSVTFQALKAARGNPVNSLRNE